MPVYQPLKKRERIFTFKVPSSKGCWIKGPGTPRWAITKAVDGLDRDTEWADALLRVWIMHEETEWNLEDTEGKTLPRTPETINEYLDPEEDLNALVNELTKRLFPSAWKFMQEMASADPNALQTLMQSLSGSSETTGPETPTETDS